MTVPNHVTAAAALGAARARWDAVAAQLADAPGPFDEDARDEVQRVGEVVPRLLAIIDDEIARCEHATSCTSDELTFALYAADTLHEAAHAIESAIRMSVIAQQGGGTA